jgi:predicted amidophosphoribosyltransferase
LVALAYASAAFTSEDTIMSETNAADRDNPRSLCLACGKLMTKGAGFCRECVDRGLGPCEACEGLSFENLEEEVS